MGTVAFTVNSFLLYLRLTVKNFQFLLLSTKFLAVLRLSVNPIEALKIDLKESRRGITSLLVMIDWTGTYIITCNIIFGMKKG